MPAYSACKMMKLMGSHMPKKNKNLQECQLVLLQESLNATYAPVVTRRKGSSPRGLINSLRSRGLGLRGKRLVTVRFAMIRTNKIRNAAQRIAHPNPISSMSRWTIIGRMTPPREDPDARMPKTRARFLRNQDVAEFIAARRSASHKATFPA